MQLMVNGKSVFFFRILEVQDQLYILLLLITCNKYLLQDVCFVMILDARMLMGTQRSNNLHQVGVYIPNYIHHQPSCEQFMDSKKHGYMCKQYQSNDKWDASSNKTDNKTMHVCNLLVSYGERMQHLLKCSGQQLLTRSSTMFPSTQDKHTASPS